MSAPKVNGSQHMAYRLEPRDEAGILLGLSALQCSVLGAVLLFSIVMLTAGVPLVVPAAVGTAAALIGFGRHQGRLLIDWAALALLAVVRHRSRRWGRDLLDRGDAPPPLRHLRLLSITTNGGQIGAVLDEQDATLTAIVPVTGTEFLLREPGDQHHLLARWGDLLGQFATEGHAVSHLCWSDAAEPSGMVEHSAWLSSSGYLADDQPSESYRELLTHVPTRALAHEVVISITVSRHRLPRSQRRGPLTALHLERALVRSVEALQRGLRNAELAPQLPLPPSGIHAHLQRRVGLVTPTRGAGCAAADIVATEAAWDHYRVDGQLHRTWWIRDWPRQPVSAAWLAPFLGSAIGGERRLTIVFRPVPTSQSRRRIERDLVRLESDAITREEKGRRVNASHRRATQALLDLEEEIVGGHPELAFVGLITVTATTRDELDLTGEDLEQVARGHGLDLQVLYAHQPEAWATALAIGIAPSRTWIS